MPVRVNPHCPYRIADVRSTVVHDLANDPAWKTTNAKVEVGDARAPWWTDLLEREPVRGSAVGDVRELANVLGRWGCLEMHLL